MTTFNNPLCPFHLRSALRPIFALSAAFLFAHTLPAQQDSLSTLFAEAMAHYRIQEAVSVGEMRLAADSTHTQASLDLATAYSMAGQREEAIHCLEAALALDSSQTLHWYKLARLREGNSDEPMAALQAYSALFETDTTNAYFYKRASAFARKLGMNWQAKLWQLQVVALQKDEVDPYLVLAEIDMETGAFVWADEHIRHALSLDSLHPRALFLAGKSAHLQKDHKDADDQFTKLKAQGQYTALAARYHGISLYHLGAYDASIAALQILVDEAPELDFPHYYMALSYQGKGDVENAQKSFETAIDKVKKNNLANYYEQLGLLHQSQEKHSQAIQHIQMARQLQGEPDHLFHLAISYDAWYQDKGTALRSFEAYLEQTDSSDAQKLEYASSRAKSLRKEFHFDKRE